MDTLNIDLELEMARNGFNKPLEESIKDRIQEYMNNPTQKGWDDIHCIVIYPTGEIQTIWQAILAIDKTFPRCQELANNKKGYVWSKIPTPELIKRALIFATH